MIIYVILLAIILLSGLLIGGLKINEEKKRNIFLDIAFVAVFLLCVLRNPSVGRDIEGYRRAYELTKNVEWSNFRYIYFEHGYILLMKICISIGLNFQWYLAVVYLIVLVPIFVIIKRYSKNAPLSVLIYICYMYFEFDLTGIRQAISMSICLLAFIVLVEVKKFPMLKSAVIVIIASLFHQGAYVFFVFIALMVIKKFESYLYVMVISLPAVFLFRGSILKFIGDFLSEKALSSNTGLYLGLNLFFTCLLSIIFIFSMHIVSNPRVDDLAVKVPNRFKFKFEETGTRMFILSIFVMLLFGSNIFVRSSMNLSQIIIILLPNHIAKYDAKTKIIFNIGVGVFMIVFFFTNSLVPNNFDIVPYRFLWQN